jgi:hypothetical protein
VQGIAEQIHKGIIDLHGLMQRHEALTCPTERVTEKGLIRTKSTELRAIEGRSISLNQREIVIQFVIVTKLQRRTT